MNLLLINPPRSLHEGNVWKEISSCTPPFGLALLSAILEGENIENDILDCDAEKLGLDALLQFIENGTFTHIGITSTTVTFNVVEEITAAIKKINPQLFIILGGIHATIYYRELMEKPEIDYIIRNEGERPLVQLMRSEELEEIPNLSYRKGGRICHNPSNTDYFDLSRQPILAYHKLPMDRYYSALGSYQRKPSVGMITSRGCPGKCTFCFSGSNKEMFGSRIRYIPAEAIIREIEHLQRHYGIREVSFYDDTFTAYKKNVTELCNRMIDAKMDIKWSCFARVDTVNEQLLQLMHKAGCHQVMFGLESGDPETLKTLNKRTDAAKNQLAVEMAQRAGINVRGAFMMGSPGETADSIRATIRYAIRLKVDIAIFNITTPFPGTRMFEWAVAEDRLLTRDWTQYDLSTPIIRLEALSPGEVAALYKLAYRKFFFRFGYFYQRLTRMRTLEDVKMNIQAFFSLLGL